MMTPAPDSVWAVLGLVGNHLWQSTGVAAVAGLLILTVRQARAQVRYWIWLAASVKFVVPFGALVALGSQVSWRTATVRPAPNLAFVMDAIGQPFASQTFDAATTQAPATAGLTAVLPLVLLAIWFSGTAFLLLRWLITWRRIAAIVGEGTPVVDGRVCDALCRLERASGVTTPIRLVSSTTTLEPGVFGIVRPVLLWSDSLAQRLDVPQIEAILAHEVSHVRRRDNLTAALHMVVEAVCWFHPLVWWLSARLVAERERACDEAVLRLGSDPHVYASGILKMCEFYVESPLACVSGVTGADLKRRIEAIMKHPLGAHLTAWRKVLLATVGIAILAGPMVIGTLNAPQLQAQVPASSPTSPAFDVASVKPDKVTSFRDAGFDMPADRFEGKGLSLHDLIATAYGTAGSPPRWLANYQITGGPRWMETDRFEVLAKAEGGISQGTEGERRKLLMLRTLLAERFKLIVHHETKNVPIYELVVARADGRLGPQLHRVADDCAAVFAERRSNPGPSPQTADVPRCLVMVGLGALTVQGQSMDALADLFSRLAGRHVVNRTALKGAFDLDLQFSPEGLPGLTSLGAPPAETSDAPSIFTAVQEQLGLKLVSTTGPVDVLAVDHAEPPTDNQAAPASPTPVTAASPQLPAQVTPSLPAFDVASVKPNKDGGNGVLVFPPAGGLIRLVNHPLSALMANAYNVTEDRIVGPDWIHTSRFDVMAKAPDASPMAPGTVRPMMRALLEERFKLAVHAESRPVPKYALVMARSDGRLGPRLQRSETDCGSDPAERRASPCGVVRSGGSIVGTAVPISQLAVIFAGPVAAISLVDRGVVDRTGLTGQFSFTLELDPSVSIFTTIQEQLGLKLEPITLASDVLVIDHVEQPTPD